MTITIASEGYDLAMDENGNLRLLGGDCAVAQVARGAMSTFSAA